MKNVYNAITTELDEFINNNNDSFPKFRRRLFKKYKDKKITNLIRNIFRLYNICGVCGSTIKGLEPHYYDELKYNNKIYIRKKLKYKEIYYTCSECHGFWSKNCKSILHTNNESVIQKKIKKALSIYKDTPKAKRQYEVQGKQNSKFLKKYFNTTEGKEQIENARKKQSKSMVKLIKEGKFTPPITNSFTHWTAVIVLGRKKYKFRSSWEACFWLCNQHLEYETFRISYNYKQDEETKLKTYISDFYDKKNNIIYELKPKAFFYRKKDKMDQIIEYCLKNNIKFIWINENNIMNYIDEKLFDKRNIMQYNMLLKGIKCGKYEKDKNYISEKK